MTSRARALAVFGAYLCLATHLAGILHVLVVRHATCPGHGEMVHGGAPVAVHTLPPPAGKAVQGVPAEAGEEQDEHCLLLATRRREMAGLSPASQELVHAPAVTRLEAPPVLAAVSPRALLLFAPKTSPPFAAV
jgi:hypothetical protein